MTTLLVIDNSRQEDKERVSMSAVVNTFNWLNPKITVMEKLQSGGLNENWMDASFNFSKQIQIMLGQLSNNKIMTD